MNILAREAVLSKSDIDDSSCNRGSQKSVSAGSCWERIGHAGAEEALIDYKWIKYSVLKLQRSIRQLH